MMILELDPRCSVFVLVSQQQAEVSDLESYTKEKVACLSYEEYVNFFGALRTW